MSVQFMVGCVVLVIWTYQLWQFLVGKGQFSDLLREHLSSKSSLPGQDAGILDRNLRTLIIVGMGLSIIAQALILVFVLS
jgi:hypothetical protein